MKIRVGLMCLLILSILCSLVVLAKRVSVEAGNRAVEVVVDYDEIARMAAATHTPCADVLKRLKGVGVTSVAVTSPTLGELISAGSITPLGNNRYNVSGWDVSEMASLANAVGDWPIAVETASTGAQGSDGIIRTPLPIGNFADLPVGLSLQAITDAGIAGLEVVARIPGFSAANRTSIDGILKYLKSCGARTVIFKGDQILGFKGAEKDTAAALRRNDMCFGRVEFSKQKGELKIAKALPGSVIVVHSVPQNEMPGLDEPTVIERFARAVRERGARMCYVRMFYTSSDDIVRDNCGYVLAVTRGIRQAGGVAGKCRPFQEVKVPAWLRSVCAAGIGAGAVLAVMAVVDLTAGAGVALSVVLILGCSALGAAGNTGCKLAALLGAIVFPLLGAVSASRLPAAGDIRSQKPILEAIRRLLVAVLTTAAGGLLVAAVMSSRVFMLRVDQFTGVKFAQMAPIVILAMLFIGGIAWGRDSWPAQKRRFVEGVRQCIANPVFLWQLLGLMAVMVILGLMVARSGNDAGIGVSPIELKFRSILDKIMLVRPRTKEFLIGYPLLLCGLAFAISGHKRWAAPLIVVGSIGLVSALNTFCHIHTPVMVSVLRVFNGAVVGIVIGLILYAIIRRLPDAGSQSAR